MNSNNTENSPWLTLEFLPDKPEEETFGYAFKKNWWGKWQLNSCTKDKLISAIEDNPKIKLAFTPDTPKLVPPETIEFLHFNYNRRAISGIKEQLKVAYLSIVVWGAASVMTLIYAKSFNPVTTLFFFVFGVIPLAMGKYNIHLKRSISFPEQVEEVLFERWINRRIPRLLTIFVTILITITILQYSIGMKDSILNAGLVKDATREGEYWRMGTCAFLHVHWFHIYFNAFALFYLGKKLTALCDSSMLSIVFLISALIGSVFSLLLLPDITSVGASGGILGIVGFLCVFGFQRKKLLPEVFLNNIVLSILLISFLGLMAYKFIDNAAHLGGLLSGFILGYLLLNKRDKRIPYISNSIVVGAGYVCWITIYLIAAFSMYMIAK
ncbi:MAG: hypothetical protein A2161_17985 [Candidatus Schekmanbacteria bacterium RBG_13_48_7]|uniref:Peptidase S54 rhomboid domain-containing protein n=1 Tax=Candidatus Schekmanbacteria bacterium RBG_13_48_7 TaxID=1817878 RepID=A0A1F7RI11_9BACT|nr:MAG: hypothetical protein A2161_17985 [Candidatus Schekmanbacteria bacterium RBG_13_48_7]